MKHTKFRYSTCAIAVSAAMGGFAFPALAQDAAQETRQPEGRILESIEVTARRTVENMQQVPLAVTSLGAEDISDRGLETILEVQQFSPNTTLQESRATNSTLTAFIRGVGQEDPLWGYESGVGIYIDDVYIARPQGAVLDILNVQRVEVLRGPQGTLYGKNTVGGALKYVTQRMTGEAELATTVTAGTYGQRDLKLVGQVPVTDDFYLGFGYANLTRDGFGKFLVSDLPGQDMENYNKDLQAYRITAEYTPADNVFIQLGYDRTEDTSNSKGGYRLLPSLLTDQAPVPDSIYDSYTSLPTANKVETEGVNLTVQWDVNNSTTLKSITSQRENYSPVNIDFDNTPLRIFDVPAIYEDEWFTQEFQLNYRADNFNVVSGLYYFDSESCGVFDAILEELGQSLGAPGLTREVSGCSNSKSTAVYADGTYRFNDQWSVSGGIRYTKDDKESVVRNGLIFDTVYPESGWLPGYVRTAGATPIVLDDSADWSKVTPRVSVEYQASADTMVYASYSEGFKSGTFNPRATTAEPAANPEDVESYEVGIKTDLTTTFRMNAAAFMLDHKNRQYISVIPDPDDNAALNQRLGNVGQSEAKGLEFEFTWLAGQNLSLFGNVGLIDADFENVFSFDADLNRIDITDDFVITNTPEQTVNVGFNYDMPISTGDIVFTGNYSYRSEYSLTELGNILEQDGYGLINLGVSWTSTDGKMSLGLHGKNLTDEEFLVGNYAFVGAADPSLPNGYAPGLGGDTTLIGYYGAPRTINLSLGYRFGR
ncbi:TonB-dependent receptor [Pseudohongiella sp.]|uniref:TonB-dependent receptor n=1 Tax=Pseudohongiella sp. TaxID=1979412 RepID=UPI0017E48E47|nr:TonB-dependent receptor [Pseudohongiella sp.]HDZ10351.1 ligand-gated channel protein [Pseudohongiella sp.]HEA62026.1 ligand-gated channel protein [Pseudohongiella sp.]